jgi:hypothetical protein
MCVKTEEKSFDEKMVARNSVATSRSKGKENGVTKNGEYRC